jgi:hypothetical protein
MNTTEDMQNISIHKMSTHKFERFLAVIGTAVCLIACVRIWQALSTQQHDLAFTGPLSARNACREYSGYLEYLDQ